MVLWQRLATCSFAPDWAGNLQSATVFPGILHLQKRCCLLKLRQFWQKGSLQQSHFRGRRHIGFLDSKKWSSPVALKACFKQNPTLIHLRHAKSFVFRAARKVPHCQKWDCHALPLFALERAIPRLFSMSILIAGETKNGHAKSTRWSVWQPCFWGCDMTLGRPQLFQKFTRNNDTTKGRKDDTNIHVLNWGGPPSGVQILYTFRTPKNGHENKSNNLMTSSCASCAFLRSRLESQSWNSFNAFPIVNQVSAGVPTPPDSGKTPQLRT